MNGSRKFVEDADVIEASTCPPRDSSQGVGFGGARKLRSIGLPNMFTYSLVDLSTEVLIS